LFRHPDLGRQLRRLAPEHDLVILQLARLSAELGSVDASRCVVDLIDSLALSTRLRARFDASWLAPALRFEARRLAEAEDAAAKAARCVLVVSERDRSAILERLPPDLAPRVLVVPLWVEPQPDLVLPQRSPIVTFTGNLGYFVNADALRWFLRFVWTGLRSRCPGARLVVAGDRPAASLRRLLERSADQGVDLIQSPQDLPAVLRSATVAIAPLRGGAGTPVKVLEAWAAGVPVIASPWAAEGTTGRAGEDLLIAEDPEEWIEKCCKLLSSEEECQRLVMNGRRRLRADYSREAVGSALDEALGLERAARAPG
jgi:glycosyltransferase involved in cell wall biosynthesis